MQRCSFRSCTRMDFMCTCTKEFFDQIPGSYFEAAELDGAGSFYLYTRICMPLSKPIISLIALQTFIGNWKISFGHGWSQKIRNFGH
mgnify:CR=1 FL=1